MLAGAGESANTFAGLDHKITMYFGDSPDQADFGSVNSKLLERSTEFCEWLLPGGKKVGQEWVCADLEGGSGRSTSVNLTTGRWADFNGSDEIGSDLISLYAACRGTSNYKAKENCLLWLGGRSSNPKNNTTSKPKNDNQWWLGLKADHIWQYTDQHGIVAFEVKRYDARPDEGHSKVIRPWDPNANDGAGGSGYPKDRLRPLYNLMGMATWEAPIVFVAGEKCADAITDTGWLGTTVAGGESAIDKTDLSPLENRDVILWPDNDDAGSKWSDALTEALSEVGVKSIRVVIIPDGVSQKWDAADADPETRRRLLAAALTSAPTADELIFFRADEITENEPEEYVWLVTSSLLQGVVSNVFGPGGCGKSLSILDLALKIATRDKWGLNDPDTFLGPIPAEAQGPTLFLTMEDNRGELNRRLRDIDPSRMHKDAPLYILPGLEICGFDPALVKQEGYAAVFTNFAKKKLPKLIERASKRAGEPLKLLILDPAGDFLQGSGDSAAMVQPLMRYLRELATRYHVAIILIGHVSKGLTDAGAVMAGGQLGSGMWTNNARFAFSVWRPQYVEACRYLKSLGLPQDAKHASRVVYGQVHKANFKNPMVGQHFYLQDTETGVLARPPMTPKAMRDAEEAAIAAQKEEELKVLVRGAIAVAAKEGLPFTLDSKGHGIGRKETRCRMPPGPLQDQNITPGADLVKAVEALIVEGEVIAIEKWHTRKNCLDLPGGPISNNDPSVTPANAWTYPYREEA